TACWAAVSPWSTSTPGSASSSAPSTPRAGRSAGPTRIASAAAPNTPSTAAAVAQRRRSVLRRDSLDLGQHTADLLDHVHHPGTPAAGDVGVELVDAS